MSKEMNKPVALIAAAVVILLVFIVGIGVYNTPANRMSRQLDLGNKYLENEQYEEAVLAFERVIAIDDRCMEAYAGAIEAYLGKGSQEELEGFYDRTLAVLAELDEEFVAQNMDDIVEIYLAADKVYETAPQKAVQILEEGLAKTGENEEIRDHLIKDYLKIANVATAAASYEETLTTFDRLLELNSTNAEIIKDLCICLNKYIDFLMENRQYDIIRALAEQYGNVAVGVDFVAILARIEELEKLETENRAFMQKVYDLMAAEDYEGMLGVYGSEEAAAFVERMEGDRYLFFPDNNESMSGTGAGVYLVGGSCFFYYGAIENGERKGTGTEFINIGSTTYSFKGEWDKDAPNGAGVEVIGRDVGWIHGSEVWSGNLVNGLWDGDVEVIFTYSRRQDGVFDLSFSAENGVPKDRTEECRAELWWEEQYIFGADYSDRYIFAYAYHQDTREACVFFNNWGNSLNVVSSPGILVIGVS